MPRYPKAMVILHWLLAFLILGALFGGTFLLDPLANDNPLKLTGLRAHMLLAASILILVVLRVIVRLRSRMPPESDGGNPLLNRLAVPVHLALYLLVFAMLASGIGMAIAAGLPGIVFGGSAAPLPENFNIFPARTAHGIFANLLILLVACHIAAALWHQFVRKDNLLTRMSFGSKD